MDKSLGWYRFRYNADHMLNSPGTLLLAQTGHGEGEETDIFSQLELFSSRELACYDAHGEAKAPDLSEGVLDFLGETPAINMDCWFYRGLWRP